MTFPASYLNNLNISNSWSVQSWDPEVLPQSTVSTLTAPTTPRERLYYATLARGKYGQYFPRKESANSLPVNINTERLSVIDSASWKKFDNPNIVAVGQSNPRILSYTSNTVSSVSTVGQTTILTFNNPSSTISYITNSQSYYGTFSGSQYLTINDAVAISTNDFTIECWIYSTSASQSSGIYDGRPNVTDGTYPCLYLNAGVITYYVSAGIRITGSTINANTWYHIALVRSNSVTRIYVNGLQSGSNYADTNSYLTASGRPMIGVFSYDLTGKFIGYISNFRIVKGLAVYTGNFSPSGPLSRIQSARTNVAALTGSETSLLTLQSTTITDNSNIVPQPTYITPPTWGGLFDGTSNYLISSSTTISNFGNDAFTFECWFYCINVSNSQIIYDGRPSTVNGAYLTVIISNTASSNKFNIYVNSAVVYTSTLTLSNGTWYHVAIVRSGTGTNQTAVYFNGVLDGTFTNTTAFSNGQNLIGASLNTASSYPSTLFSGYIASLRVVKGIAVYTGTFTPIGPLATVQSARTNVQQLIGTETSLLILQDGTTPAATNYPGGSAATAAPSAAYLTGLGLTANGVYWINLPTVGPTQVYCILDPTVNGGGWMMAMKTNIGTTFNYSSPYWTTNNTLNTTDVSRNDGDAKFHTMNYTQAKDIMAIWPDIPTVGGGLGSGNSANCWTWLENNFNSGNRSTLINFFNTAGTYNTGGVNDSGNYGGYFLGLAKSSTSWGTGVFSSQNAINFYGFNFKNHPNAGVRGYVRWGFGWNENGEGNYSSPATLAGGSGPGSDDVSGGIGMDTNFGNYSSGDYIGCCNDTTGINRTARVEIYIR